MRNNSQTSYRWLERVQRKYLGSRRFINLKTAVRVWLLGLSSILILACIEFAVLPPPNQVAGIFPWKCYLIGPAFSIAIAAGYPRHLGARIVLTALSILSTYLTMYIAAYIGIVFFGFDS